MTLEDFQANGDDNLMLIIDDFHCIKPKSNGRFNLFMQKIVERRVNLIIVTNGQYQKDTSKSSIKQSIFAFQRIKPIKVDRLCPFEIDLIAFNTLDLTNKKLLEKYEQLKKAKPIDIRVEDILSLKSDFYGKKKQHDFKVY